MNDHSDVKRHHLSYNDHHCNSIFALPSWSTRSSRFDSKRCGREHENILQVFHFVRPGHFQSGMQAATNRSRCNRTIREKTFHSLCYDSDVATFHNRVALKVSARTKQVMQTSAVAVRATTAAPQAVKCRKSALKLPRTRRRSQRSTEKPHTFFMPASKSQRCINASRAPPWHCLLAYWLVGFGSFCIGVLLLLVVFLYRVAPFRVHSLDLCACEKMK